MRGLKVLVVVMGVMIVAGVVTLGALLAARMTPSSGGPVDTKLDEPEGTSIAGIAVQGDNLAVQLRGGGPDRVVMIDLRRGRVNGRVGLAR